MSNLKKFAIWLGKSWVPLILILASASLLIVTITQEFEPEPEYTTQQLEPVDKAFGYFGFSVPHNITPTGTIYISQTLKSMAGEVLARRYHSQTLSMSPLVKDVVTDDHHDVDPWPIVLTDSANEWSKASWRIETRLYSETLTGILYTDFGTPVKPDTQGWYLSQAIEVSKLYMPIVSK